ncbi:CCC motif membrane protein [uncultured Algibacter sp.]|uniref:CCC motif membrane protein n=1 Tax=uncultured Algibacter sp. TaxID=298659 RepID=UPI003216DF5E
MSQNKLPADPLALILAIIALVITLAACCCYGIFAIIPLIISIIGLVSANRSLRAYANNPEVYSLGTRSNVYTSKILNIIAIVFSGIMFLWGLAVVIIYGSIISLGALNAFDEFKNAKSHQQDNDTIFNDSEDFNKTENDSIILDSFDLQIENIKNSN